MRPSIYCAFATVLAGLSLVSAPAHAQSASTADFTFDPPAGWTLAEQVKTKGGGTSWRYTNAASKLGLNLRWSPAKGRDLAKVTDQFLARAKKKPGHRILSASRITSGGKTMQVAVASRRDKDQRTFEIRVIAPLRSGDFLHVVLNAPRGKRREAKAAVQPILDAVKLK